MNNSSKSQLTVLDCTFRDGGYYNDWYFEPKTVNRYLSSISAAGVDVVEIGLRMPPQKNFCGPFAYCTDEFLSKLEIPKNINLCVMINAKDFIEKDVVSTYFNSASQSPVKVVRIAAHFKEIEASEAVANFLSKLGYRIGFNLMQATGKSPQELQSAASRIAAWGCVEVLYFADSFGNMKPTDIKEMIESLRKGWSKEIGIHAHDNMGLALSNSIEALDNGATWLDSTVLGMGRGAGNTQTEHLLVELSQRGYSSYNSQALFALVLNDFTALKEKYGWGQNLLYYLSAAYSIHPTYIQELLSSNNRDSQHILDSLDFLKASGLASSYDAKRLAKSSLGTNAGGTGTWSPKKLNIKDEVVIIGPGKSVYDHKQELNNFIAKRKISVLATNTIDVVKPELVTAHVACHHTKLMLDYDKYKSLKSPVILPVARLPEHVRESISKVGILDYGLVINENNTLKINDLYCEVPTNLVAGYAIAIAIAGGAKNIYLAGFDGFDTSDPQHIMMQNLLDQFISSYGDVNFVSITPTKYKIKEGSVYAPGIMQ